MDFFFQFNNARCQDIPGRLTVLDVAQGSTVGTFEIKNFYQLISNLTPNTTYELLVNGKDSRKFETLQIRKSYMYIHIYVQIFRG